MTDLEALVRRAKRTQQGFLPLRTVAAEIVTGTPRADAMRIARQLLQSEVSQARMIAAFILGALAGRSPEALR
jgi:hypothetical protein